MRMMKNRVIPPVLGFASVVVALSGFWLDGSVYTLITVCLLAGTSIALSIYQIISKDAQ